MWVGYVNPSLVQYRYYKTDAKVKYFTITAVKKTKKHPCSYSISFHSEAEHINNTRHVASALEVSGGKPSGKHLQRLGGPAGPSDQPGM